MTINKKTKQKLQISLRQLDYFIAAADTNKFSQAAIDLNVSQSAITAAIQAIEKAIGATLFERHKKGGVSLTYNGSIFLGYARNIVNSAEEMLRSPTTSNKDIEGTINIGISYTVAGYFLPPHLARFFRDYPKIKVNITEAGRKNIEQGLLSKDYDLAIVLTSNLSNQEYLSYQKLLESKRQLWVNAHHPFLKKDFVSLEDISKEPYIMLTVDEASITARRYWNKTKFQPNVIFKTASIEAVRSMVANGVGVSILSDLVHKNWSLDGQRIESIPVKGNIPTMDIGFVWAHDDILKREVIKIFMKSLHLYTEKN